VAQWGCVGLRGFGGSYGDVVAQWGCGDSMQMQWLYRDLGLNEDVVTHFGIW
jgi:hypothetical protein